MNVKTAAPAVFACRCSLVTLANGDTTGCTGTTNRAFRPGHDAKLKSLLGQAQADGSTVTVTNPETGKGTEMSPLEAAGRFGNFGYMVVEIAAKLTAKRERATAHKAKLAANKAKREAVKAAKTAKVALPIQKAKVGRGEFEGVVKGDEFHYQSRVGESKATKRFKLIG